MLTGSLLSENVDWGMNEEVSEEKHDSESQKENSEEVMSGQQ